MNIRDEIKNFFGEDGLLAKRFANYEYRKSQEDMALAVLDTLEGSSHIFVEAPTGVGKSFAYLVPAIYYAKANKKKAIISTHTINLQEQLIYKDIPFLEETLPIEFKANLLKGRSNYLCPKRLKRTLERSNSLFESDEQLFLDKLYQWAETTEDGTISDLTFPLNQNVWNSVCSERGICTNKTCGGSDTDCFYYKAKAKIAGSDVVIVNHHLFFTLFDGVKEDKEGYLYLNDFVIFDEAHTLEAVAAEHIFPRLSREMVKYQLLRLYNDKKRKGLLVTYPSLHILPIVQNLLELNNNFFHEMKRKVFTMNSGRLEKLAVRIYEKNIIEDSLSDELDKLVVNLRGLRQHCIDEWDLNELNDQIIRLGEFRYVIRNFIEQKHEGSEQNQFVYWVEAASQKEEANISLCSSSIDISSYFRNNIFRPNNSAVLTSATLTINNSFLYFKKRLGGDVCRELNLPSQFDFYRQVKIYIPKNIPTPTRDNDLAYRSMLTEWIIHFTRMTEGKALVLFTNSYLMRSISSEIKEVLYEHNIDLLVQGQGMSRNNLLDVFKSNVNSVLLGLDSFWLGVDVPGEALSNLIITKLPFLVPDHPLVKARMEYIDDKGGNSFMEYSLPEAILKFRQGIGRLIRHKSDTGIIVILDNRIISKAYGKYFLNSIDECEVEIVE